MQQIRTHLPGFVTRNLRLKGLAAGIALVTWVGIVYASNPPESRTVSVHAPQDQASLPAKYVLASSIPDISVRLSGTRDHVAAFDPAKSLVVTVDYKQINAIGMQQIPVHVVNNDSTVTIDSVPSTVTADVDVHASVNVPVNVVLDSTPPTGYVVSQQSVNPNSVVVTGPQRELTGLSAQVHLNLANQKTNLEGQYKVVIIDRFGHKVGNLGVPSDTVTIGITVSSVITSRSSAVLPRVTGSPPSGRYLSAISATPLTVVLNGPQDLLNGLDSIATAPISLTGLSTGDHAFQIKLAPPPGVSTSPDTVSVTVTIAVLPSPTPTPTAAPSPTPLTTPTPTSAPPSPTP
jgi:YbbR domain-containing protein